NSVSAAQSAEQQGTEATEPGDVDLVESLDSTNGLFTVTYDKDLLKYIETASELEFKSVHADEENGKIVFAYAFKETEDAKNIPAGETLATVKFQAPCEDQQITVTTTERNTELDLNETADAELEGTGHDWQLDGFTWDGTESATANFVCANDETHTESVPAEVTSEVTPSTATAPGKTTYTATVEFGGETYTDEIVEEFSYAFTKGADGEYDVESGLAFDIEVKRSADDALTFGLFEALKMDGTVIAPANYTASEGSLKATLSAAYMATLDEGEHTLTAVFKDGVAETKLTVTQEDLTPPATGDRPGMLLWVILAAVMAAGMAALLIARRERF
ncbi:MAG: hypothetical protein J6Z38_00495, partial [Lachnospiraceae bacterium]|nr:hypothetical protein [Lachnospiraceae bacterium]